MYIGKRLDIPKKAIYISDIHKKHKGTTTMLNIATRLPVFSQLTAINNGFRYFLPELPKSEPVLAKAIDFAIVTPFKIALNALWSYFAEKEEGFNGDYATWELITTQKPVAKKMPSIRRDKVTVFSESDKEDLLQDFLAQTNIDLFEKSKEEINAIIVTDPKIKSIKELYEHKHKGSEILLAIFGRANLTFTLKRACYTFTDFNKALDFILASKPYNTKRLFEIPAEIPAEIPEVGLPLDRLKQEVLSALKSGPASRHHIEDRICSRYSYGDFQAALSILEIEGKIGQHNHTTFYLIKH